MTNFSGSPKNNPASPPMIKMSEKANPQENKVFTIENFAKSLENSKTEPQQEIAAIGYFLLRQRAESVGAGVVKDFNPSSVAT